MTEDHNKKPNRRRDRGKPSAQGEKTENGVVEAIVEISRSIEFEEARVCGFGAYVQHISARQEAQ